MKLRKLEKLTGVMIVLTLIFIWGNSLTPGSESAELSSFFTDLFCALLRLIGINAYDIPKQELDTIIRKTAHFTEYFICGAEMTLYFCLKRYNVGSDSDTGPGNDSGCESGGNSGSESGCKPCSDAFFRSFIKKDLPLTLSAGLLTAVADELLQLIPEGRSCRLLDMCIDSAGFFSGSLAMLIIIRVCLHLFHKQ